MKSWPLPSNSHSCRPGDYDSLDFTDLLLPYIPRWVKENYKTHHICPVFAWKIHMVSQVDWSSLIQGTVSHLCGVGYCQQRAMSQRTGTEPWGSHRFHGDCEVKFSKHFRRTFKFSSHSFLINFTYIIPKGCQGNPKMQRFWQQLSYDGQWNKAGLCSQQPSYKGGNWVNKEWESLISYPCGPDLPILGWSNPAGSKNAGDVGGSLREEQ